MGASGEQRQSQPGRYQSGRTGGGWSPYSSMVLATTAASSSSASACGGTQVPAGTGSERAVTAWTRRPSVSWSTGAT